MLNKKLIISFIIALIALIVVGFVALNFVPHNDILDLNLTDNATENITENLTENLTVNITDDAVNGSEIAANESAVVDANNTNARSDVDEGDLLKKQTFTVTANETGQYKGMEPGTYVLYYTENDGLINFDNVL